MLFNEINFFKKNGYVCFKNSALNAQEIDLLSALSKSIFENFPTQKPGYLNGGDGVLGLENIPIYNQVITQLLAKILTFPDYKNLFNEVLGSNYKVWAINFRRSSPNDLGLYLHQDGLGQVNLAILLDNNLKGYGSTAVLPGSHLIIHSIKKMKLEVPAIFINWFKFLFKPLSGERGDIAIFSNRTWHGRFSNNSDMSYDVILVGFFPERYAYNNPWPKDFIRSNQGTDFGKLLATSSDLIHANGISDCNSRELGIYYQSLNHGYSMLIENEAYLKSISHPLGLRLKLFFMIYLVKLVRFIRLATKNQLK